MERCPAMNRFRRCREVQSVRLRCFLMMGGHIVRRNSVGSFQLECGDLSHSLPRAAECPLLDVLPRI